jgi:hypothetical protein
MLAPAAIECPACGYDVETAQQALAHVTAERDEARAEAATLRAERQMFRARLAEIVPWVGACPFDPAKIREMVLARDLASDALAGIPTALRLRP